MLKKFGPFATFFLVNLVSKGLTFLMLPIITRKLSPSDYGVFSLYSIIINYIGLATALGLPKIILLRFPHLESWQDKRNLATQIFNLLIRNVGVIFIILITGWFFFFKEQISTGDILILLVTGVVSFFFNATINYKRIENHTYSLSWFVFFSAILSSSVILGGIFIFNLGYMALVLGLLFNSILGTIYFFGTFKPKLLPTKSLDFNLYKLGIPLVLESGIYIVFYSVSKWFLNYYYSTAELGIMEASIKIGSISDVVLFQVFNIFYFPYAIKKLKSNYASFYRRNLMLSWSTILVGCSVILLVPDFIWELLAHILGPKFSSTAEFFSFAIIQYIILVAYNIQNIPLLYAEKVKHTLLLAFILVCIQIGLSYAFIPSYGIKGALLAPVCALLIINILQTLIIPRVNAPLYHKS